MAYVRGAAGAGQAAAINGSGDDGAGEASPPPKFRIQRELIKVGDSRLIYDKSLNINSGAAFKAMFHNPGDWSRLKAVILSRKLTPWHVNDKGSTILALLAEVDWTGDALKMVYELWGSDLGVSAAVIDSYSTTCLMQSAEHGNVYYVEPLVQMFPNRPNKEALEFAEGNMAWMDEYNRCNKLFANT